MGGRIVISRLHNEGEANVVRTLLESYGIPVSVGSDITHSVYPLTVDGLGEIRLSIPEEFEEEARRILEAHPIEEDETGA